MRERETARREGWDEEFKSFDYVLEKGREIKGKGRIYGWKDGWRGTEIMNCVVDKASDRGSPEAQCFKTEELAVHRGILYSKGRWMGEEHSKSAQRQPTYKVIVKNMGLNRAGTIRNNPTHRVLQLSGPVHTWY